MSGPRLFRIDHEGNARYAVESGGTYRLVEGDVWGGPRELFESAAKSGPEVKPARILSPVTPSKVVAIGLNYKDHAAEMNKKLPEEPLVFSKPPSSVIGPEDAIRLPAWAGRIDYEAEMAVVMGRRASRVKVSDAMDYVLGLTCLCDVTARDLQNKDVQYTRAKGFDSFGPIGPCIAIGLDPSNLSIEGWVNGDKKQSSNTHQLIFPVPELIEFVTRFCTLEPGDIITTGTPSGVGPLKPGDRMMVKVAGIGALSNPCIAAE